MPWFLLAAGGIGWLAYTAYKAGKRTGSRKAFGAGRARQRRSSYRRGGRHLLR